MMGPGPNTHQVQHPNQDICIPLFLYSIYKPLYTVFYYYKNTMEKEPARQKWYKGLDEWVYAPQYYLSREIDYDPYSEMIVASKQTDKSDFFIGHITDLINELISLEIIKDFDLITNLPSFRRENSPTLIALGEKLSQVYQKPYKSIFWKVKDADSSKKKPQQRYDEIHNSFKLSDELDNIKTVLLIDDVKTTGITLLEAKSLLITRGINTISICLGINKSKKYFYWGV